jgi:TPR repeat protein
MGAAAILIAHHALAAEPLYGEKGGFDLAMRAARQGRIGEAEHYLRDLKSAKARVARALMIARDNTIGRQRGITSFDPTGAPQTAKELIPELNKQATSDLDCAAQLGTCIFWGVGAREDKALGFRWWKYAAEHGSAQCMASIALAYRDGIGTDQNKAEAFRWAKNASDAGSGRGMQVLADFYDQGYTVPKNHDLAVQLYEKSAGEGWIDSMLWLGSEALKEIPRALDSGDMDAVLKHARSYVSWTRMGVEAKDSVSMLRLADLYRIGFSPIFSADPKESWPLYKSAAQSGLSRPLANLACCFLVGLGCDPDPRRAESLLKEAVAACDRDGQEELGSLLRLVLAKSSAGDRKRALLEVLDWRDENSNPSARPPVVAEAEPTPSTTSASASTLRLEPSYQPKAFDRAILVPGTPLGVKEVVAPTAYVEFGDFKFLHEVRLGDPGAKYYQRKPSPTVMAESTPIQVLKVLDITLYSGKRSHETRETVPAIYFNVLEGELKNRKLYCDPAFVGRLVGKDYPPVPIEQTYSAPVPVAPLYRSQEAQRQRNMMILGQMTQQALENGAADQEYLYRSMTPGSPRAHGQSHYCGAPTLKGGPCQRLVIGPGYCWQHR